MGGPQRPDRPLYVSNYMLDRHRDHKARTQEILRGSRQVKVAFPSTQIPMDQLDELSKVAKAAKMRLWIDMQIERWTQLDWHVCWITVTLPGKYVPHATNEKKRKSEWDTRLGPDEATEELQELHRQTLAILKKKKIRTHGWWNSQPQQSGVPHRHYVLAAPTLEQARAICDDFRRKFSTSSPDDDLAEGQDRGCQAYVIGDDDKKYRPRKSKNGSEETVESVAKYAARYATRYETTDIDETDEGGEEIERFFAWAASRNARKHAWLGLDSQRAPGEIWDTLWKRQKEGCNDEHPRMKLTLREMSECQSMVDLAIKTRQMDLSKLPKDKKITEEQRQERIAKANKGAALHAWHAAIAMGLWPDDTLADAELSWLRSEIIAISKASSIPPPQDALPPAPIKEEKESAYGETRQSFVGTAQAIEKLRYRYRYRRKITLDDAADIMKIVGWKIPIERRALPLEKWHYLQTIEDYLDLPADNRFTGKSETELKAICDRWDLAVDRKYYEVTDLRLFLKSLKRAGFGFSKRPCGELAFYAPSDEIFLKTQDEWEIMHAEPAQLLKEQHEMYLEHLREHLEAMSEREREDWAEEQNKRIKREAFEKSKTGRAYFAEITQICDGDTSLKRLESFSLSDVRSDKIPQVPFSQTDPSNGPAGHSTGWTEAADPPPI
ncbi:replication endonuclease (plasmid) [Nitratireductor sp. GZWM139]|nr:replication endonuclease [Nitratireductor sp. GZWM139]